MALGIRLGNLKFYSARVFRLGSSDLTHPPLEGSLLTGGMSYADQYRQDLQKGAAFVSGFIQNLAIVPGDY